MERIHQNLQQSKKARKQYAATIEAARSNNNNAGKMGINVIFPLL